MYFSSYILHGAVQKIIIIKKNFISRLSLLKFIIDVFLL